MHGAPRDRREAPTPARLIATLALGLVAVLPSRPVARAPEAIRVLVFNIHAGKDAAGAPNLDRVAALVTSTRSDIVLLQEIDRRTARSGGADQVDALKKATGYEAAFGPSLLHYDGGEYGIAILSRTSIGFQATTPLPVAPVQTRAGGSHEPRVALLAFVPPTSPGPTWHVVNTHLDPAEGGARAQEVARLVELYQDQAAASERVLLGGDLNSTPGNPVVAPLLKAGLHDAWTECGSGDGLTYPADKPAKRIDYLFLPGRVHCSRAEVIDTQISDHRPLRVTLGVAASARGDAVR